MRTIKISTGAEIPLDGDILTVMETLYHEITARRELERSFEDIVREIRLLIDQMTEEERRAYLQESLFLNTVTYENERLGAYMRKLAGKDCSADNLAKFLRVGARRCSAAGNTEQF